MSASLLTTTYKEVGVRGGQVVDAADGIDDSALRRQIPAKIQHVRPRSTLILQRFSADGVKQRGYLDRAAHIHVLLCPHNAHSRREGHEEDAKKTDGAFCLEHVYAQSVEGRWKSQPVDRPVRVGQLEQRVDECAGQYGYQQLQAFYSCSAAYAQANMTDERSLQRPCPR